MYGEISNELSYKEFIIMLLTLLSGLACTNLLNGVGLMIKRKKEIKTDWVYFLASFLGIFTVGDYWFHAYKIDFSPAEDNIIIFFFILIPSCILFFNTLILFPMKSEIVYDYVHFFQKNLRHNVLFYGLFVISIIIQMFILGFLFKELTIVLILVLLICVLTYVSNSIMVYKAFVVVGIIANLIRWFYEGSL